MGFDFGKLCVLPGAGGGSGVPLRHKPNALVLCRRNALSMVKPHFRQRVAFGGVSQFDPARSREVAEKMDEVWQKGQQMLAQVQPEFWASGGLGLTSQVACSEVAQLAKLGH